MILSVSRRTDIPRFFMEWFANRIKEGFLLVRNPMNPSRISRILINPESVGGMVFWTKDPSPMFDYLPLLEPYPYYVQFTVTPYGPELESALPGKEKLIETFLRLSEKLGPERVVWRLSPVIITGRYTPEFHLEWAEKICRTLEGHTEKCNLGFLEVYKKIRPAMDRLGITEADDGQKYHLARELDGICRSHGILLGACGNIDCRLAGVPEARCVDARLIEKISGKALPHTKGPGSRSNGCYCSPSVDVGEYNTCLNGCRYCYANHSPASIRRKLEREYHPLSPILCGRVRPGDVIRERKQ